MSKLESLYDYLATLKRAKMDCIKRGHNNLLDQISLEIIRLRKQIREERERNNDTGDSA